MMSDQTMQGERVRAARKARRMTQAELAEEAGISLRTLQDIENDKRKAHPGNIAAVRRVLGLAGDAEETRQEYPPDVQVLGYAFMAYLMTMDEERRTEWSHDFMRRIIEGTA